MLSLNATQQALVASAYKKVTWLFEVTLSGSGSPDFYWSTKSITFGGQAYAFKVIPDSFQGINLSRAKSEYGLQAPNTTSFKISNKGTALDASAFEDAKIHIKLVIGDGTDEEICAQWVFMPTLPPKALQQTIEFDCIDYISRYLNGNYPNTPLIKDLFPSKDGNYEIDDNMCVPIPFGTAYIPLRSVYTSGDRYYVLGPAANTYTVTEVRSPRSMGANASYWDMTVYTPEQSNEYGRDGESYKVIQAIIADADGDGTEDANGLWLDGKTFADMPTQFTRNDTASMTDPAVVIWEILKDFGIPFSMLDNASFSAASAIYASWGLTWNFGLFFKQDRRELLANLLAMCHSTLVVEDTIKLKVLTKVSQKAVTSSDILRRTSGETSFNYSYLKKSEYDSACVAYQVSGEPIDELVKIVVPIKSTSSSISNDLLKLTAVHDSQKCQKLGTLNFQRRYGKSATVRFDSKGTLLALQPDDVVSFNDHLYGGAYSALVDDMRINRDVSISFTGTRYEHYLDDWGDLSPGMVTVNEDDSTATWTPVIVGPDGFNILPGKLRIGEGNPHIAFDPNVGITAYNGDGDPFFSVDITTESINLFSTLEDIDPTSYSDLQGALADIITAQATADGKIVTFWQDAEPSGVGEADGDLWIDTDDNNNLYRYDGTSHAWIDIQDGEIAQALSDAAGAQATADGKITTFYGSAEPTADADGDLWFDTDDDNKIYRWDEGLSDWIAIDDQRIAQALASAATAQATADGKIVTFYQAAEPSGVGESEGDLWIDTDDDNNMYRYNGAAWEDVQDGQIATALANAAAAQSTADGKIVTFFQAAEPTAEGEGDMWFDTDDNNKAYRWSGSAWVEIPVYWDNLYNIPSRFADAPDGAGLFSTSTYLGFYDSSTWKVYIANSGGVGIFYAGDGNIPPTAGQYIYWDGTDLFVNGSITITSGSGYDNLTDKPIELGDINSTEGTKLGGIEDGADVTGAHLDETRSDDFIIDGDCERTDMIYWRDLLDAAEKSSTQVKFGTRSIMLDHNAAGGDSTYLFCADADNKYNYIPVFEGDKIFCGCWVYPKTGASANTCKIFIQWVNGSKTLLSTSTVDYNDSSGAWEELSGSVTAPANARYFRIYIACAANGVSDDVSYWDALWCRKTVVGADITSENTAASITGQGDLATQDMDDIYVDYDTQILNIPTRFEDAPSGTGLKFTDTYLGFYSAATWQVYIQNDGGVGKFYAGNGSTKWIDWDGTNLNIATDGSLNMLEGGDIKLIGGSGTSSSIDYYINTTTKAVSMYTQTGSSLFTLESTILAGAIIFQALTLGTSVGSLSLNGYSSIYFQIAGSTKMVLVGNVLQAWSAPDIGGSSYRFGDLYAADGDFSGDIDLGGSITSSATTMALAGASNVSLQGEVVITSSYMRPVVNGGNTLGNASYRFANCHCDDFTIYGGTYDDDLDDLAILNAVTGTGKKDKHGRNIIDKLSLPDFCTNKDELRTEYFEKNPDGSEEDFREELKDDNKLGRKIGLRLGAIQDLTHGAVRQLKKEMDELQKRIDQLEAA